MRFRLLASVIPLSITLIGCSTMGNLEDGLRGLVGQPVQSAFDTIGYPDSQQEFGATKVYTWSTSHSGSIPTLATGTNSPSAMTVTYACKIKLAADESGTVRKWEYEGNPGGCQSYAKLLKRTTQAGTAAP